MIAANVFTFNQFDEELGSLVRRAFSAKCGQELLPRYFPGDKLSFDEDWNKLVCDYLPEQCLHGACMHSRKYSQSTDRVNHLLKVYVVNELVWAKL